MQQTRNIDPAARVPCIEIQGLVKVYGSHKNEVKALKGVSFKAYQGEILGVLGPNGAGKTTLIEILEGVRKPTSGRAALFGVDLNNHREIKKIRHRIGIAMQDRVLPRLLKVKELVRLHAVLGKEALDPDTLIDCLNLTPKANAKVDVLSGGQQQRLTLALALVRSPDLLFLDEPTSQLDPQARRVVWRLLLDKNRPKRTIVITTHQMEEAQKICDRVAILDHGELLDLDTPRGLIDKYCPQRVLEFTTSAKAEFSFPEGKVHRTQPDPDGFCTVKIKTEQLEEVMASLMRSSLNGDFPVENLRLERQNLEDVFLHLTGRRIRN